MNHLTLCSSNNLLWYPYEMHNMIMAIFVLLLWWIFRWVEIWDCNCSLFKYMSSYCISLLFFIVLAPYEMHNMIMAIFVLPLWWIFLWVEIWDCNSSLISKIVVKYKAHVSFITFILEDEYRLSMGMLMHVKCINDLCTLPLDILSYLHHILVIFMLLWWLLGIIHKFPNFIGLIRENQKTSISMFLLLGTQTESKWPETLRGQIFFYGSRLRSKGSATKEARGPSGHGPCGQIPWPRGAYLFPPRCSDAIDLCPDGLVLT
jgi:hypothetical protein